MKRIFLLLLLSGIIIRFIFQFIYPTFDVDEISLGNNIKHLSFIELLYPLKFRQSSPPLFLWIEKSIVSLFPFNFWINIKILSFISSCLGIFLFYIFIKKNKYNTIFLLLFTILLFNPFNIYNSLTVKQYTIDLTGILFILVYFKSVGFKKYSWLVFLIWSLMSNIGLFSCFGYLFYLFLNIENKKNINNIIEFAKKKYLLLLATLPYLIYFLWFMKQKGAVELKEYMTTYWSDSFIPFNSKIFKYLILTAHNLWVFIFSASEIWGIFLTLLIVPLLIVIQKREYLFKEEVSLLFCILCIHLGFNMLHLYPFSDRLFLYLTPFFILILGASLSILSKFKNLHIYFNKIIIVMSIITLVLYTQYMPFADNDLVKLYKKCNSYKEKKIYTTEKALSCIKNFDDFTDNIFKKDFNFIMLESTLVKSEFIITRVAKKYKKNETAQEETLVQNLINSNKIKLVDKVDGYNIYKIIN